MLASNRPAPPPWEPVRSAETEASTGAPRRLPPPPPPARPRPVAVVPGGRDPGASASSVALVTTAEVGRIVAGRYRLTKLLGEGGMGVVYQAWDQQVERAVAIKLMRTDVHIGSIELKRFRRELEVTSRLRHPSTVRVFEHGETPEGRPYMVMELLRGHSLGDRLEAGPLDELEALQIVRQVAESLSEAHEHGVFHRDLKPDNVFIETVGVSKVVKVLDFGIAGGVDSARLTQAGEVFGTPQYMSPEQCNGVPLDHRTDIYSLACILYELVEGRPPFVAETPMATMLKHVRCKVPMMRRAHPATVRLIALGLRKDRTKRIQSAGRFAELVGECIGKVRLARDRGSETSTPATAEGPKAPRQPRATFETGRGEPPKGSSRGYFGLAVVGMVALATWAWLNAGVPTTSAMPAAALTPSDSPLLLNRALVRTNIGDVDVLVDGRHACVTPCEIEVPVRDGQTHEIRLRKPGFTDVVHHWAPQRVDEPFPALPDLQPR